jgi:murein DD-endopeptidase MepM/ murein hydrolase activator NlpD
MRLSNHRFTRVHALPLPLLVLVASGCASMGSTMDTVKDRATQLAQVAKAHAEAVYQRQQHYLTEHDVLKTFEDASEHSEAEVLKVLHAARKGSAAPNEQVAGSVGSAKTPSAPGVAASGGLERDAMHWPVEAGVISSDYGERWGKMHKGIDIAADVGEPVYAVADGDVIYAGDGLRGYGNVVIIQHGQRLSSLYAHNSTLKVKQGDRAHGQYRPFDRSARALRNAPGGRRGQSANAIANNNPGGRHPRQHAERAPLNQIREMLSRVLCNQR